MTASPRPLRPARPFVLAIALALAASAAAAPPPAQQVPGVQHRAIGPLRVTALFDGIVPLPRQRLRGIDETDMARLQQRDFVPEAGDGVQTAVNAYLVHNGHRLTLVDTGTAGCFGDALGQVPDNLRAAGYRPEDVDDILLTHAHPDHICGLLDREGRAVYPRATVWLSREDADYWLDPATERAATTPEPLRPLLAMARRAVAPYRADARLRLFDAGDTLPGAATAASSHGHTPGHTGFLFEAGDQRLLVWGDLVHYHAVQFARPEASFEADADRAQAIASRREQFARAADGGWWVAGAHLPFPGLGHVRREGAAYAWVPVEFAPLPVAPAP
ncbi:MBL fold metallo-hydrolase [Luteimonas huabeiensis]|uniref:MBL fold metallo-hydrolase n=1 Tax=Luteimonas huabeiensis TaxID=1244513 RepID=UPI0004632DC8|nr:MBL fold metallo-hydrolase [Luteimonas huabeiensis]